jgi:RNA polymerase sigma-70 factor (ECF subfamily)
VPRIIAPSGASNPPGDQATSEGASGSDPARASGEGEAAEDLRAVARARNGDHAAFRELVERTQGRAFGLALRVLRDEEVARDVVQDAYLKAYGSLDRFEGRSSFYTWLYRIVMNLCLDRKRRERSSRRVDRNEEALAEAAADPESISEPEPQRALERAELRGQLARAIALLPEDARRTLELREIDGLSYQEIAECLGVPKGTVMSRLHHARRRVRLALVAAGVVEDQVAAGPTEEAT